MTATKLFYASFLIAATITTKYAIASLRGGGRITLAVEKRHLIEIKDACPCDGDYDSHEDYVGCAVAEWEALSDAGLVDEKTALHNIEKANDSDCGRGGKTKEKGDPEEQEEPEPVEITSTEEEIIKKIKDRCPCGGEWADHAAFVDCIIAIANELEESGDISNEKAAKLVGRAQESDCGEPPLEEEETDVEIEHEVLEEELTEAEKCKKAKEECLEKAMRYEEEKQSTDDEEEKEKLEKMIKKELSDVKKYQECIEEAEADAMDTEAEIEESDPLP